jgi:acyl-CoA reductase-like NAD-dependent aldehyde dehydrogenase
VESLNVKNPATGALVGSVPVTAPAAVRALAARARAAQSGWRSLGPDGRGEVLRRAQRWLADNAQRVIGTVMSETGKSYEDAQLTDYGYTLSALGYWAKHGPRHLADERVSAWRDPTFFGRRMRVRYEPYGVVGVVGPWNFPLVNGFGDCIPALMAGNAVILKPSEVTPLSSLLMAEMLSESGMPADVFQVACGDGATGAALVQQVDCMMFTGSTRTGRAVAQSCAERLIPCYLELGGKDPMLVLADADVERAANAAAFYSMNNAGQVCISIERAYVEAPIYDEFVRRVTGKVAKLRQGPPDGPGSVDVGAMTFAPQLQTIEAHVADALAKGGRVLTGGQRRAGAGNFYEPTVLVDVDHTMACMREETFGPLLPIMRVDDLEQAVSLANDSPYGLQASVWTRDLGLGRAVAMRLQAGAVCVNDAQLNYTALNLPMGGWKSSGLGTRHGRAGIRKYCKSQSLLVTVLAPKRDFYMFPYRAGRTRLLQRLQRLLYVRGG